MKLSKYSLSSALVCLGLLILPYSLHVERQELRSRLEFESAALSDAEAQNAAAIATLEDAISELGRQSGDLQRALGSVGTAPQPIADPAPGQDRSNEVGHSQQAEKSLEARRREMAEGMNTAEARESAVSELLDSRYRPYISSLNLAAEKEARLLNVIADELDRYYSIRVQLAAGEISFQDYQNYPVGDYLSEAVANVLAGDEYRAFDKYFQRPQEGYYDQFASRAVDQLAVFVPTLSEEERSYVAEIITGELYKLREGITFDPDGSTNRLPVAYRYALESLYQESRLDGRKLERVQGYLEGRIRRIEESTQ